MPSDDAIKELAAAMNRLAAAIEAVSGQGLCRGIEVRHSGLPQSASQSQQFPYYPQHYPY